MRRSVWPIARHYRLTLADALIAHDEALRLGQPCRCQQPAPDRIRPGPPRPYSGYHRSIERKAAAILHAMVSDHGFVDGNKRTARP